jgi:hypothetical protein
MSLGKIRPKCKPTHRLSKSMLNLNPAKSIPKLRTTFVIFEKNCKAANSHPKAENSSNLVTLVGAG